MILAGFAMMLGAWKVRDYPVDAFLLGTAGAVGISHPLLWQTGAIPHNSITALIFLLFGPTSVYAVGLLLAARYFWTPVRGWPKTLFLAGALIALSPIILLFVVGAMFAIHS